MTVGVFDVGVLTVVTAALLAWSTFLVVRLTRPGAHGGVLLLVVAVAVTGWAGVHEARHQFAQFRATAAVRDLTGNPAAAVRCQRFTPDLLDLTGWAGHVSWDDPHTAHLRRTVCNDLAGWLLTGSTAVSGPGAQAVHVLTHEAVHVTGQYDEAATECEAIQRDADTARLLGADDDTAEHLARIYLATSYPYMPDEYRSPGCAENGPLDLSPGDGQFP